MIETVFSNIGNIFTTMWLWIAQINNRLPFLTVALGVFLVYTLMRFIVIPLLKPGVGRSDSVTKKKEEK